MKLAKPYSAQKENPLLYWATLIYVLGAPNFIHFDESGRTHGNGLFNLTSISTMFVAFFSAYALLIVVVLARRPLLSRKVNIAPWLWILLLLQLILSTVLQPANRVGIPTVTDMLISFYRMFEWLLAFALVLALYTRTPAERATDMIVQLIGRASWICIAMTWIMLPIMPSHVYGGAGEGEVVSHPQLGGEFISPSYLSSFAVAAFFYSLFFFPRGIIRFTCCVIAFVTLVLAHTRIEQISFLTAVLLYAICFSSKFVRLAAISLVTVLGALGVLFFNTLLQFFARGQSASTLATLDDRTRVWQASLEAVRARPFLGYGFVMGAKHAIQDHWKYAHWSPPHAHNEYIHGLLSGGVFALALVLCIYGRAVWAAIRSAQRGPNHVFLLLLLVLFMVRSIGGTNFTAVYTRVGALFLLTFIGIMGDAAKSGRWKLRDLLKSSNRPVAQEVGT